MLLNKDLIFTALNQLWKLISGPLLLLVVPLYLTPEEQGYWYTFSSLAALAIMADLGFSTIILQFAAHEFAYLSFDKKNNIVGNEFHLKKLATFFIFCLKWATCIVLIVFPIILCIGFYLLSQQQTAMQWHIPWLLYGIASGLMFLNSSILFFLEGCSSVARIQKLRLKVSIVMTLFMFGGLIFQFKLYALSLSLLGGALCSFGLIYRSFGITIKQLIAVSKTYTYSWKKEFLSLIWRYAISWASGYFIFQIYTPLTFQIHGAIAAGKVGISIALWTAVFSLANTWISAIIPKLNIYIEKKEWKLLDKVFYKNLLLSIMTFSIGVIIVFLVIHIFKGRLAIIDRFVSNISMMFLAINWFLQIIINTLAVYLRAHKEEPLVLFSFSSALYISVTTFLCIVYLPIDYLFVGYFSSYLFALPWIFSIFNKKRKTHL